MSNITLNGGIPVPKIKLNSSSSIKSTRFDDPSIQIPPFMKFLRRHEKDYASEIGQLNIMLRESKGIYERNIKILRDIENTDINFLLCNIKSVEVLEIVNIILDKIVKIKKDFELNNEYLFDYTTASKITEKDYQGSIKAATQITMLNKYDKSKRIAINDDEEERVQEHLNIVTNKIENQLNLAGSWKTLLYDSDGNINMGMNIKHYSSNDQVLILKEMLNSSQKELNNEKNNNNLERKELQLRITALVKDHCKLKEELINLAFNSDEKYKALEKENTNLQNAILTNIEKMKLLYVKQENISSNEDNNLNQNSQNVSATTTYTDSKFNTSTFDSNIFNSSNSISIPSIPYSPIGRNRNSNNSQPVELKVLQSNERNYQMNSVPDDRVKFNSKVNLYRPYSASILQQSSSAIYKNEFRKREANERMNKGLKTFVNNNNRTTPNLNSFPHNLNVSISNDPSITDLNCINNINDSLLDDSLIYDNDSIIETSEANKSDIIINKLNTNCNAAIKRFNSTKKSLKLLLAKDKNKINNTPKCGGCYDELFNIIKKDDDKKLSILKHKTSRVFDAEERLIF